MRFLLEVVFAIGLSALVLTSPLGVGNYIVTGSMLSVVALAVIYATHGFHNNKDNAPTLVWFVMTVVLCILLGAMWPALPVIFFYERDKTKRLRAKAVNVADGNAVTKPETKP